MIWGRKAPEEVRLHQTAIDGALRLASQSLPAETGGILIGWRTAEAVHVTRMLQVPDHEATAASYQRNHEVAEAVLQQELASPHVDPALGYVGEWHSHPAPLSASAQDRREIASISRLAGGAVAMLLLARDAEAGWSIEAITALSRKVEPAVVNIEEERK